MQSVGAHLGPPPKPPPIPIDGPLGLPVDPKGLAWGPHGRRIAARGPAEGVSTPSLPWLSGWGRGGGGQGQHQRLPSKTQFGCSYPDFPGIGLDLVQLYPIPPVFTSFYFDFARTGVRDPFAFHSDSAAVGHSVCTGTCTTGYRRCLRRPGPEACGTVSPFLRALRPSSWSNTSPQQHDPASTVRGSIYTNYGTTIDAPQFLPRQQARKKWSVAQWLEQQFDRP